MLVPRAATQQGGAGLVGVGAVFGASAVALAVAAPEVGDGAWGAAGDPLMADGVVSGVFVAATAAVALVRWRRDPGPLPGWLVTSGLLLAGQAMLVTLVALYLAPNRSSVVATTLVLVSATGLASVACILVRLRADDAGIDDRTFGLGLGLGLTAAAYLLAQVPVDPDDPRTAEVVIVLVLATHVAAVGLVLQRRVLGWSTAALLVLTAAVVAGGTVVSAAGLIGTGWDLAATIARALTGAAWLAAGWRAYQLTAVEDREVREEADRALRDSRHRREQMHELRSTMAGLVQGSELLEREEISAEVRERLWGSVRRELDRMNRLLHEDAPRSGELDLDEALDGILDLQRLKGRRVELRTSSVGRVHAPYDSIAEVLNILIDNAATHGGTDSSLVEVTQRDDDTVDIEVTDFGRGIPPAMRKEVFDWGKHGSDSPGEGIGLNVARRLMTEAGGGLRLRETQDVGSSFVISLPAARRSTENDLRPEARENSEDGRVRHHAW